MDSLTKKQNRDDERSEENEDVRPLHVRLERVVETRPRSGSRGESGDRDRSPIRCAGGGGESITPPSTSFTAVNAAGEAEATRTMKTRSGKRYAPTTSEEDDDGADSDASVESVMSARSSCSSSTASSNPKGKKRGRPPTTGEYVGMAEAKKKYVESCEAEEQVRVVERILDPALPVRPPSKGSKPLPDETSLARDFRQRPTADVAAAVLESQQEVERVASVSKGLQGGLARALRIAALSTRTAVMELATRSATSATRKLEEDNNLLRQQVAQLTAEVERLRQDFDGRQTNMLPPPVPPPRAPERKTLPARPAAPCREEGSGGDAESVSLEERILQRLAAYMDARLEDFGKRTEANIGRRGIGADLHHLGGSTAEGVGDGVSSGRGGTTRTTGGSTVHGEGDVPKRGGSTSAKGGSTVEGQKPQGGGSTSTSGDGVKKQKSKKKKTNEGAVEAARPAAPSTAVNTKGPSQSGATPAATTTEAQPEATWAKVVGRKEKGREKATASSSNKNTGVAKKVTKGGKGGKDTAATKKPVLPARPPRTAAVTVTVPAGANTTYEEVLRRATTEIKLADLGIDMVKPRGAVNGGLVLEIPGQNGQEKAANLAAKMAQLLDGTGARVGRPIKKAEIRVRGLIPSITPTEVATAIATIGGCSADDVQTGEIRSASSGLGTLWARCPVAAARKLAVAGKFVIGWTQVAVEALQARPLQCFKCLEVGHTREKCPSGTDRSGRCYNCGDPGHKASACSASPKCPVCIDKGGPAGHRLGGRACVATDKGKKKKGGVKKNAAGAKAAAPAATTAGSSLAPATEIETVATVPPTAGPAGPEGERMITE